VTLPRVIETNRLVLRATEPEDWRRAVEIQSNWNVTRNLRMAAFPPDEADTRGWFASHAGEWEAGTAYRFAILSEGRMIGVVDVDGIRDGTGSIGYWLEEAAWGRGYASEAAAAIARFSFEDVGLKALRTGHAVDNAASGKILLKLGFVPVDEVVIPSRARGGDIVQRRYRLVQSD
jgi:ribosomal-protein-alanine N-acetyltransferase